jgi:outer membrane protein OmpA-like peptidoglycan-associated protein
MRPFPTLLALLSCAGLPGAAAAEGFPLSVRATPGFALPLSEPQASTFGAGFDLQVAAALELLPSLDVDVHATYLLLSSGSSSGSGRPGTALGLGAGARFRFKLDGTGVVPWAGLGLDAVDSAGARLLLTPAAGLAFPLDAGVPLQLGPFVRYHHLFGLWAPDGFESFDASVLSVGLSLEWRDAPKPPPPPPEPPPPPVPPAPPPPPDMDGDGIPDAQDACPVEVGPAPHGCPDSDGDGISDGKDPCPSVQGPPENTGCPLYREVTVTKEKIEISEKIFFAYGKTSILPRSLPLLNEVATSILDRKQLCIRVEGHADSSGDEKVNLPLSEGRAEAVRAYLVSRGVDGSRVTFAGYGSRLPRDNNATADGRDNNRRVEFVVIPCPENAP